MLCLRTGSKKGTVLELAFWRAGIISRRSVFASMLRIAAQRVKVVLEVYVTLTSLSFIGPITDPLLLLTRSGQ